MPAAKRHTETVLKSATAAVRAAVLLLIALTLFIGPVAGGRQRTAQIVCFLVGTAAVLGWAAISWRRPPGQQASHEGRLVVLFAVMAAASVACTTDHGGVLISFALLAAVAAGAGCTPVSGWAVAGVGVLAVATGAVITGATTATTLGHCLEVVVVLLLGRSRQAHRVQAEQSARLLAQADLLRTEQSQVATLSERARIAREIHDVLAHSLGALGIQIQAARALLSDEHDTGQALTVLNRAQRIATEGLDETRRAVHALRADTRALDQELAALAATHRLSHHVAVDVRIQGPVHALPPDAALALLRTAQEALVNAAKHAPGQSITMQLTFDPASTDLKVSNRLSDTCADPRPADNLETIDGGYGLLGMRERLLLLHGSLTAHVLGGRWEVSAQVPL